METRKAGSMEGRKAGRQAGRQGINGRKGGGKEGKKEGGLVERMERRKGTVSGRKQASLFG